MLLISTKLLCEQEPKKVSSMPPPPHMLLGAICSMLSPPNYVSAFCGSFCTEEKTTLISWLSLEGVESHLESPILLTFVFHVEFECSPGM